MFIASFARNMDKTGSFGPPGGYILGIGEKAKAEKCSTRISLFHRQPSRTGRIPGKPPPA
jgi:hypothetical protein